MRKSTRIQSNDYRFTLDFAQRCVGHEEPHEHVEGGRVTYGISFYPKAFCQRAVHLWKSREDKKTPKGFIKRFREDRNDDEVDFVCGQCGSKSLAPTSTGCIKCSEQEEAYPAVSEFMIDIAEDDEGDQEQKTMQRLLRIHKNLGHPSNKLLVQILKEAKAGPQRKFP